MEIKMDLGIVTARDVFYKKRSLIKCGKKVKTTTLETPVSSVANTMLSEVMNLCHCNDSKKYQGL